MPATNKQKLSLPILTSLVIGNMIGTGIFLLPSALAAYGSISLLAWILTSTGALFLALTFGNLNRKMPKSGGAYIYCKEAYGNFVGFLVAYTYWISLWVATAGIAVSTIGYLGVIIKGAQHDTHPFLIFFVEVAVVWFFTLVNIIGILTAGFIQLVLTVLKIAPLVIIIIFGLFKIDFGNFSQFNISGEPSFNALTHSAALIVWAFIGLETATIPAENAHSSADVYKATVYGTLLTALIYILSTIVLMGLIPPDILKNSTAPFADVATLLFGKHMAVAVAVCAIVAGIGSINVCTLLQGQIPFVAARDHLFPRIFSKVSRFGTPIGSQIISAILITIVLVFTTNAALMKQFNFLALLATLATLVTYFICTLAEMKFLLRDSPKIHWRGFIKPFVVACVAAIYSFWMMVGAAKDILLYGTLLVVISIPIYFWLIAKKNPKSI